MRNQSFSRISAISRLVFLDGLRRQAIVGLILFALAAELFGMFFMDFFGRDIGRASSDYLFSIMWISGMFFLFFHAVQTIAMDEERKTIYNIISRPVSRNEYVQGMFLGLGLLLIILHTIFGAVSVGTLYWIKSNLTAEYFSTLNFGYFILTWCGLVLAQLIILSVILLFSGLLRGGFPVMLVSVAYYLICSGLPVAREYASIMTDQTFKHILTGLAFIFPDFSRLDFKDAVVGTLESSFSTLVQSFTGMTLYLTILIFFACSAYRKKDI